METSAVSVKPTLYPQASQASETSKQEAPQNRPDEVADNNNVQAAGDTVSLSTESLQLAKSTSAANRPQVPVIEDRGQAQQAVQNIVERMRQQATAALDSQSAISGAKLKSLLA